MVSAGCHVSPSSIVKGSSTVPDCMKVESHNGVVEGGTGEMYRK